MNSEKLKLLEEYLKNTDIPILLENVSTDVFNDYVILPSNLDIKELNGHYEETSFNPPKWYDKLLNMKKNKLLVIDKIDSISKEEQAKFIEILKYKKVSTFELPKETKIIITADVINEKTINEEIYSLVAHIKE